MTDRIADGINAPIRVLLVDDDEDDAFLTEEMLMEIPGREYRFDWSASFDEGLVEIRKKAHDVYLIDYRLGAQSKTGLELLREANARESEVPFILLMGLGDREVDVQAAEAGASDYLVKGQINAETLERSIRYSIAQHKLIESLKETERKKEMFVATLTHDLRTPIKAEYRVLEQLQEGAFGELSEDIHEIVRELMKSNRFMNHMVDNLLSTYRFDKKEDNLNLEPVNLGELIRDITRYELKMLADEKHQELRFDLPEDLPLVPLDAMEITRVLYNLIQNAVTYTPAAGIITVQAMTADEAGRPVVRVAVSNTGPGIDPEQEKQIFQPYLSLAKKYKQVGTGLGLYLCRRIVEAHGGTIGFENNPGEGCLFYFTLPLSPVPVTAGP